MAKAYNKHIKNRPQKTWAGLANARLLCGRYGSSFTLMKILISIILLPTICLASNLVHTFCEAVKQAKALEENPIYKIYESKAFIPAYEKTQAKTLQECFAKTENPDAQPFEMVLAINELGGIEKIYKNKETNIGSCLFKTLKNNKFQSPPSSPFYIHIVMSFSP